MSPPFKEKMCLLICSRRNTGRRSQRLLQLVEHQGEERIREANGRNGWDGGVTALRMAFCIVLSFRTTVMFHMLKKKEENE